MCLSSCKWIFVFPVGHNVKRDVMTTEGSVFVNSFIFLTPDKVERRFGVERRSLWDGKGIQVAGMRKIIWIHWLKLLLPCYDINKFCRKKEVYAEVIVAYNNFLGHVWACELEESFSDKYFSCREIGKRNLRYFLYPFHFISETT